MIKGTLELEDVSDGGERVTHLCKNDVYYAHLSIYHFALKFCTDKTVLDAGSGAGYGSAYLADNGAKLVDAFDIEEKAVLFSRKNFSRPNLRYQVMSIENVSGFDEKSFDVIFSSNALEHIPNVYPFFRTTWSLLNPSGTLIIAVPPVVDEISRRDNINNPYHLNIWTPRQWYHVINLFFKNVQPYIHTCDKPGVKLDFDNTPNQTRVNETDFDFIPVALDEFSHRHTLTVVFTAQEPRPQFEIPSPTAPLQFIDDSFTRSFETPPSITATSKHDHSLVQLIQKAWKLLIQDGPITLLRRSKHYLSQRSRH